MRSLPYNVGLLCEAEAKRELYNVCDRSNNRAIKFAISVSTEAMRYLKRLVKSLSIPFFCPRVWATRVEREAVRGCFRILQIRLQRAFLTYVSGSDAGVARNVRRRLNMDATNFESRCKARAFESRVPFLGKGESGGS